MSNVSIYEKSWTDLVFENKNKAYGAYQLRQENSRTTLFAFLSGLTLIVFLFVGWFLFSSFGHKTVIPKERTVLRPTIIPVTLQPKKEPLRPKAETKKSAAAAATENKNKRYEASTTPDDVEVPKNETPLVPTATGPDTGTTGPAIDTPTEGGFPTGTVVSASVIDNSPKSPNELDRLPEYPGGISKFYQYIIYNIDKPEVDDNLSSISVLMSFVIERDGSMTDIKALRSTDINLEREAIKVLKASRVKWSPGFKDNQKMRTLYVLPIKVAL
jgi:protein TonB